VGFLYPFLFFQFFFSMSELLFLFAIILRFVMLLCLKEWKLLMLALTYDMDTLGVEFFLWLKATSSFKYHLW
jgi:hypothetical protein